MNFDALIFFLSKYIEYYPYLLPIGLLGGWRWSVWGIKKFVGSYYQPKPIGYKSTVSVITPVYNENTRTFTQAINSWAANKPNEIIAVIDYTDKANIAIFKKFARRYPSAKLIITKIPGKRDALAKGIKESKSEILALVDSDTIWEAKTLAFALAPFKNKSIGGVTTKQTVENPVTLAQKLFSIRLEQRYWDDVPFLAKAEDILVCLSGRTSLYRRKALLPVLKDMLFEKFMGEPVISGEDKRLTYLIEKAGWKTTYQSNALVLTTGVKDLSTFFKQQIRWTRNSWRNDLRALLEGWTLKHPIFTLYLIDRTIQPFTLLISPIYFIISLYLGLWTPVIVILVWWHLSRWVKMSPHLKKYPGDIKILPIFILFNFTTAYIRIYSLLTINTQGWITRWDKSRLSKITIFRNLAPHFGTLMIFSLIGVLIADNKYQNLLVPQAIQRQLVAQVLPKGGSFIAQAQALGVLGVSTVQNQGWLSQRHDFKTGESLQSVAEQYEVSVENLLAANAAKIINRNNLEPGTSLTIPPKNINLTFNNKFNNQKQYPNPLQIYYDAPTDQIIVSGRGKIVTLRDIAAIVGPELLEEVKPGIWDLKTSLYLRSGLTLPLKGDEVSWLRLASNDKKITRILAYNSDVFIDGVKITSWDNDSNDYDRNLANGRSYVLVKDGSRMDLNDSEIAYLGYPRSAELGFSPYGISWKMSRNSYGKALLTGKVTNSKFHDNYFGAYTFGAIGMVWQGNEFYDNVRYGLDPHDDSNGFLVENNIFHNNGSHGLIFSKRCVNNTIINNISYNNKLHGIMLHELSNNNLIEGNEVFGNSDGITLDHSSGNIIKNNYSHHNKRGVLADKESVNNQIADNRISLNSQYGVYLYGESDDNIISDNTLTGNVNAIYIKTANNQVINNVLNKNKTGIYFLGDAEANKLSGNKITYSQLYGIYTKANVGLTNFVEADNYVWRNRTDLAAEEL